MIMSSNQQIKDVVKQKYSGIALQGKRDDQASCCNAGCCSKEVYNIMSEEYSNLEGYNADADLGLGCGLPTQFAKISKGDTVIDLGSGAGNDCFIARHETGENGKVIGIDFTPAMIEKAWVNAGRLKYTNIEFRLGDIEKMPVADNVADVIVSNCVLNLVADKDAVFKEIFRVLKPGGHFSISDIVLTGNLPEPLRRAAEMYAGCVSGAIQKEAYMEIIHADGFFNIIIQKEKSITIPDGILKDHLNNEELKGFKTGNTGIFSITVYGEKPKACCGIACCS